MAIIFIFHSSICVDISMHSTSIFNTGIIINETVALKKNNLLLVIFGFCLILHGNNNIFNFSVKCQVYMRQNILKKIPLKIFKQICEKFMPR